MRRRLAVMMFLEYAIIGVWGVTLPTFLMAAPDDGGLGLPGQQVGLLFATFAIAAIGTPFVVGLLADRFFASQRLFGVLHLLGAVMLVVIYLSAAEFHTSLKKPGYHERGTTCFGALFPMLFMYAICYMPSLTLGNTICFRNLRHPMHQFGHVRVFGTVGWIAAGLFVGVVMPPVSPVPLICGAGLSLLLGLYAFTLPHTPPAHEGKTLGELFGVPAIKMFARPSFRSFVITSFIITLVTAFQNTYLNRYLVDLGVQNAAAWQTTGQITEIICILALPWMHLRVGLKPTLFVGLAASVLRFALYSLGNLPLIIAVGIPLQGVCFAFYFIAALLFIDRHAPRDLRASAQGLLAICTSGLGAFAGNWVAGLSVDVYRSPAGMVEWPSVWAWPTAGSLIAAAYFAWQFREPELGMEPLLISACKHSRT